MTHRTVLATVVLAPLLASCSPKVLRPGEQRVVETSGRKHSSGCRAAPRAAQDAEQQRVGQRGPGWGRLLEGGLCEVRQWRSLTCLGLERRRPQVSERPLLPRTSGAWLSSGAVGGPVPVEFQSRIRDCEDGQRESDRIPSRAGGQKGDELRIDCKYSSWHDQLAVTLPGVNQQVAKARGITTLKLVKSGTTYKAYVSGTFTTTGVYTDYGPFVGFKLTVPPGGLFTNFIGTTLE